MKNEINLDEILTDQASEEDFVEIPLSQKVFRYFFIFSVLLLVVVFGKTFYLSIFKHQFYVKKAEANINNFNIKIAPRGIIYDAFGNPLVKNVPTFNAFVAPFYLPANDLEKEKTLEVAGKILNLNVNDVIQEVKSKKFSPYDKILLKADIDQKEFINLNAQNLEGIEIVSTYKTATVKPYDYSHLVGYTNLVNSSDLKKNPALNIEDSIGRSGLEAYYDNYLRGVDGKRVYITNASGNIKGQKIEEEERAGFNLNTSIDSEFQDYFYNSLSQALKNLGRNVGVGIALNPQNGQVLALFNIPSFETDKVGNYLNAPYHPLFNRAISGLYSPGSTIKPLVALGALVRGILDPHHQIFSPGYIYVPNPYHPDQPSKFLDWQYQGWIDMYSAIARSSDVYFYAVGGGYGDQKGLGIKRLKEWWQKFLLDQKTGIDLPQETSGFLPDPDWKEKAKKSIWRIGDTYNVSIGQGDLLVTPIELLNYIAAIANGGIIYKPQIVKSITDQDGRVVVENHPQVLADLRNEVGKYIREVQKGMEDTVSKPYGTAYLLHDLPMQVAAKTGSAQVANNTETNAFFVGYAPAHNPQIAILILVENAKEGSLNVVPVAKDIFSWYYQNRLSSNH